ncbi:amp- ligase [Salix suchowensis]|nr:amp- ligase [Salix suchowensis]
MLTKPPPTGLKSCSKTEFANGQSSACGTSMLCPRLDSNLVNEFQVRWDDLHGRCSYLWCLESGIYSPTIQLRLPEPSIIYELLTKAGAKALIVDEALATTPSNSPVPVHTAVRLSKLQQLNPETWEPCLIQRWLSMTPCSSSIPAALHRVAPSWFTVIRSGYTVWPARRSRSLHREVRVRRRMFSLGGKCPTPPVSRQKLSNCITFSGSMCHIAQNFAFLGYFQHNACVVLPTVLAFPSEELVDMITRCGLNRLNQFATYLSIHLKNSRRDAKLLSLLAQLDEILYTGLPLNRDEEAWAYQNNLNLRNVFGNTECGAMLLSVGRGHPKPWLLRPLENTSYGFAPIEGEATSSETTHSSSTRMLELVIFADSEDCPAVSLCQADGHFHTGDLFNEVSPGLYISRVIIDASTDRAIEDNVRAMCGDVVGDCIVVGSGRPSPVLFVEPATDGMDEEKLKKTIIRKTRAFHVRRYLHERITSTKMIIVVAPRQLPRTATKGNIRRKLVEDLYKDELDHIFGVKAGL